MILLSRYAVSLLLLVAGSQAAAVDNVRAQEISECRSDEMVTWGDGMDRGAISRPLIFGLDPAATPVWFDPAQTLEMVQRAANAWSACGVPSLIMLLRGNAQLPPGTIRIHWDDKESRGNFGLSDLGRRTITLSPAAFALLRQRNPAHDIWQTLQTVLSHEMGHFYGLMAHSRRCIDVLSYYHNDQGEQCLSREPSQRRSGTEYRHFLPTACDIERCRRANGMDRR